MKKLVSKCSIAIMTIYTLLFYTLPVYATVSSEVTRTGYLGNVENLAFKIINYILGAAGLVAVIYLIIGGFNYITAGGNEEQTKKATKTLFNAVIGLVIIFAAYAIVVTVQTAVFGTEVSDINPVINAL
ncbi:pilin [Patescibacteria group bacterium]|nr:pilin [Patescibacteria group bacterium]